MLKQKLNTKSDLMRVIQSTNIKKIIGVDVDNRNDVTAFCKQAEQQLASTDQVTVFLIRSTKQQ